MKTRRKRKGGGFLFLRPLCLPHWIVWIFQPRFNFSPAFSRAAFQTLSASTHQTLARLSTRTHTANALFLYPAFCFLIPRSGMSGGCEQTRTEICFFSACFFCSFSLSLFLFFLFLRSVKINVSKKSLVLQFRYRRKFFSSGCESWWKVKTEKLNC